MLLRSWLEMRNHVCGIVDAALCLELIVGHGGVRTAEVCDEVLPGFVGDLGEFKATQEVHIDFGFIPAIGEILLCTYTGQ